MIRSIKFKMYLQISFSRFIALAVFLLVTVAAVVISNSHHNTVKVLTEANDSASGTLR